MRSIKSTGDVRIVIEAITLGGDNITQALAKLFIEYIYQGTTPSQWSHVVIVVLHTKGDATNLKNYHPISLLLHIYMLFTKIDSKRLAAKLDCYQPREQAGFR